MQTVPWSYESQLEEQLLLDTYPQSLVTAQTWWTVTQHQLQELATVNTRPKQARETLLL